MRVFFIIISLIASSIVIAQVEVVQGNTAEQQLENLTELQDGETEDDTYLQSLIQFRKNKLNLNVATANELRELRVINDLQIRNFIRYRQLLGNLISVYELQAVPGWDVETIQKLLPYVAVGNVQTLAGALSDRFSQGQHSILIRGQRIIERSNGYLRPDSVGNRYPGSPERIFVRYKYVYRNLLQYGLVADKDAGEQFFKGSQNRGFDFYSFHLFARKLGPVKLLALGDFTVNMGQGLIHWQSLAFKKNAEVTNVKRQADIFRPYNSAGEYNFQRGVGVTVGGRHVEATVFGSKRNLDATFNTDTSLTNEDFISSILNSGYHRTPNELNKRNTLEQISFGGNVSYNSNSFHVGANAVAFQFSAPLVKGIQPYNQYAIQGKSWHNYSVDYSFTYRNMHFFGEAAIDKRNAKALLGGMIISLDKTIDASLLYRNIEKSYQTLYGNAFTESTFPSNEKGLFAGISIRPIPTIKLDAYADVFSFPWLRFRVDAPGKGTDYFVQLTYRPNKLVEVYTRYRNETKAINLSGLALATRPAYLRPRQDWRIQVNYKVNRDLTIKNRAEILWYDAREQARSQQGFLIYTEASFKKFGSKLSLNGRLQYFETDGFDSRLYAYENDVLYSYSIPQFIGKGVRYYLNLNYDVSKKMTLWLRWAQTRYTNQKSISSGLDEIAGRIKSEVKLQMQYIF